MKPDFDDTQPSGPAHDGLSDGHFVAACLIVFALFLVAVFFGPP